MQLYLNYGSQILIFVIFASSLNLLSGYTGIFSVAHAAFGAVGGYTVAYLWINHQTPLLVALVVGLAFAAALGASVALPAVRLAAEWLMLLTLALHVITVSLLGAVPELGGAYGLQNVAGLDVLGHELDDPGDVFALCLVATFLVLAICFRLGQSPYGRVLRAIREDEIATASLGKPVARFKLAIFTLTAVMAALAGALLVIQNSVASPGTFQFSLVTTIVAVVIIGGSGNLAGSVLGAVVVVLLNPALENLLHLDPHRASLWREIIFGALLILVMFVRPRGLLPEESAYTKRLVRTLGSAFRRRSTPESSLALAARGSVPTRLASSRRRNVSIDEGRGMTLEVRGLSKRFGGIVAAHALDLELRPGTITGLVGPNGAGKTTLFNLLTGSIPPDAGTVLLDGQEITSFPPDRVARLGMVRSFQDVRVFPRLTALQNVALAIPRQPGELATRLFLTPVATSRSERGAQAQAAEWLQFVGLEDAAQAPASSLAFGEQKLLALARALATGARVLLLDEPAAGMDVQWVDRTLALIARVREEGKTVCIVEHNLHVVSRLADRVYFMEVGQITAEGTFEELTKDRRLADAYFGAG